MNKKNNDIKFYCRSIQNPYPKTPKISNSWSLCGMLFLLTAILILSLQSAVNAGMPAESKLYKKFIKLPADAQNSSFELKRLMRAEIKSGTCEVETYILMAIAELADGDVELFMRNVKKANKLRFYKFQPFPLAKYEPFVNHFVNVLRNSRELHNRSEIYPNSSMIFFQFAMLCREFDKKFAILNLKRAINLYDDFLDAHLKLAELYEECMDYNRAIGEWGKIMQIRPYDFRPYYKICHLATKMGDFTIGEEIYEKGKRKKESLHEHKEFQEVIEALVADIPRLREERKIAVEKLIKIKELVQNDPLNIDALLEASEVYYNTLCDIKQAEQACVKAIHVDQLNYKPHLLYSKILWTLGETDKAYEELLFTTLEGGEKVKNAYTTELIDLCEKKLISDMVQNKLKMVDLINYFSIYYQ